MLGWKTRFPLLPQQARDIEGAMTQLTPHFALYEFLSSETAARMGREIVPTPEQAQNIRRLCETLLEPIRVKLERAMVVTSGLRPDWLNVAIGGAAKSAHMDGLAADIKIVGMSPATFCRWVRSNGFAVDQCIEEFGQWSHLSIPASDAKPRNEYLIATRRDGATHYEVMP